MGNQRIIENGYKGMKQNWLLCPICSNKTRLKIRSDTEIQKLPLFCPKCKQEILINVKKLKVSVIKEPDALDAEPINL